MNEYIFNQCQNISDLVNQGKEDLARDEVIKLLDYMSKQGLSYNPLINALIREVGLYPYMEEESSSWTDAFTCNLFKVDVGLAEEKALHREQYRLLKALLDNKNIAVSAPTSFGKSFVVDAFIKLKKPNNVMIIVPTIALTDETRRRIYKKFSQQYNIITTTDADLAERNIFIFPQERAIHYVDRLESLDILIIDEFYKSSKIFEKERAANLIKAIIELGHKAKQRYYLAPNISRIEDNPFTKDMEFMPLDFKTVFLSVHNLYDEIKKDNEKKKEIFLDLQDKLTGKTLIYAGTYTNITTISNLLLSVCKEKKEKLLDDFSQWLGRNYDPGWVLPLLIKRGIGIHNGHLHRSLSQIQIKLFEENTGLDRLISTSSIIEGVNTSAENVIVWITTSRGLSFSNFSYKNLIGRAGRMFKHFIGNIYVLAKKPEDTETQLDIPFPDEILGTLDKEKYKKDLTRDQVAKINEYDKEMEGIMGEVYYQYKHDNVIQSQDSDLIKNIARKLHYNQVSWKGLQWLNNENPDNWDKILYKILGLQPGNWSTKYKDYVAFIKVLSKNWNSTIPDMLSELDEYGIGIDEFFKLERSVTFNFATLVADLNKLQMVILNNGCDISAFQAKLASAFLPKVVYQLEEYGLPRMISKKIHNAGLIDFEDSKLTLKDTILKFKDIGEQKIIEKSGIEEFEKYILHYFFDGISSNVQ